MKNLIKKIKQLLCQHVMLYLVIDLDAIHTDKMESARCPDCGKKIVFKMTAYSIFEEPLQKSGCKKRRYPLKKDAEAMMNRCKKLKRKRHPRRVYYCKACKAWHLTSLTHWNG